MSRRKTSGMAGGARGVWSGRGKREEGRADVVGRSLMAQESSKVRLSE